MIDQRYLTIYEQYQPSMSFMEFMLLIFVYEEQSEFLRIAHDDNFMEFTHSIRQLEESGLVKWHGREPEEITLRKTGEELFKKHVGTKKKVTTAKEVGEWIQSWRELFPEGVNSGGYRYRGDKGSCLTKMIKFVNTNDYSIEQIFQATKDYVERFSLKGYAYMQLAHYFIEKKGVGSTLSAECEGLAEKSSNNKEEGGSYGRSIK
jgi:hypothetical protein